MNLYFKPEAERARRMRKDLNQPTAEDLGDDDREAMPDEETFVRQWSTQFGGTDSHWREEYRKMRATARE